MEKEVDRGDEWKTDSLKAEDDLMWGVKLYYPPVIQSAGC